LVDYLAWGRATLSSSALKGIETVLVDVVVEGDRANGQKLSGIVPKPPKIVS
jgi:hypothetical protein